MDFNLSVLSIRSFLTICKRLILLKAYKSNEEILKDNLFHLKVGDPEECRAIDEVMCKNRKGPLLIGSVKSNMGHAGKFHITVM